MASSVVQEGDQVVFMRHGSSRVFKVRKNRQVFFEKNKFRVEELIGQPYGTSYEIQRGKLIKLKHDVKSSEKEVDDNVSEPTGDNRDLHDLDSNQKMSRDDIVGLREKGLTGEKIIEELVENSETFQKKTEFSRAKYLKKKKKVHILSFTVLRPTPRLVMDIFAKEPGKICNLRPDTLSQVLNFSNIRHGSNVAVVESCHGLVLASVLRRLGGKGKIVQLIPTGSSQVNRQVVEYFNFTEEEMKNVYSLPMEAFSSFKHGDKNDNSPINAVIAPPEEIQISTGEATKSDDMEVVEESTASDAVSDKVEKTDGDASVSDGDAASVVEKVKKVDGETSGNVEVAGNVDDAAKGEEGASNVDDAAKGEVGASNGEDVKPWVSYRLQQRAEREAKAKAAADIVLSKKLDSLIIVCKYNPLQIVQNMLEFMPLSRPVVVFCQFIEPLVSIYSYIKENRLGLQVQLSETWLRDYQILPQRTHPMIHMSGTGGYLLTFMTCDPSDKCV